MVTICTGWKVAHPVTVLKAEDGVTPGQQSHGMCSMCRDDMQRDLTAPTPAPSDDFEAYIASTQPKPTAVDEVSYEEYLAGPFDPRD